MKIDKFREESENNLSRNEANSTIKHIGLMVAFDNVNYYQNCVFKNKQAGADLCQAQSSLQLNLAS